MTATRVVVLQHEPLATVGWLGEVLAEHGIAVEVIDVRAGAPLPKRPDFDALVSLGADLAAYDEAAFGWLADEKALVRAAVERDVPVLGICLGAQVIADALGGRAFPAAEPEVGFMPLELTDDGRADPVLRQLDTPTLLWHADTFALPPSARLLATSERYPQAFRAGSALGVQFHPETSPAMLRSWVTALGRDPLPGAGTGDGFGRLVPDADRLEPQLRDLAWRLFGAWIIHANLTPAATGLPG